MNVMVESICVALQREIQKIHFRERSMISM